MSAGAHRDHRDRGVRVGRHQGQLTVDAPPPAGTAGGARRYRLRPSIEVVPAGEDLLLLRAGETADLAVRTPDEADRQLLATLSRRACTFDVLASAMERAGVALPAEVLRGKLEALLAADAVVVHDGPPGTLTAVDALRFDRQLPYLAERGDPERLQARLRDATVVVLGCGGLGTWSVASLASLGVGSMVLVDDDRVELSNLNRQILFGAGDVGGAKAELAAAWLARFDPRIAVRTVSRRVAGPGDLEPLLRGADALVHAADSPPYQLERWVNEACLATGVPWIASGQMPPTLKVGPTYVPGRTACFACHERALAREHPHWPEVLAARTAAPAVATTLGPASGLLGTTVALQLLDLLTGADLPATAGRALLIDMRTLASHYEAVERDPDCPACAGSRAEVA